MKGSSLHCRVSATCLILAVALLVAAPGLFAQHEPSAQEGRTQQGAQEGGHSDSTLIWKWANFALLAGALGYYIVRKGGPFFRSRTEHIQKGISEAAELKAGAEERYAAMERRLAGLDAEVAALKQQASRETAAEAERLLQETADQLVKLKALAQQEVEAFSRTARQKLKEYSTDLAIQLAEEKVRRQLTPDGDRVLVESFVANFEKGPGAQRLN